MESVQYSLSLGAHSHTQQIRALEAGGNVEEVVGKEQQVGGTVVTSTALRKQQNTFMIILPIYDKLEKSEDWKNNLFEI